MNKEYLYSDIAGRIAAQIRNGLFKAGDKLPSVRSLCQEHHVSMNTAKRVYWELESQSLIESKPQSGYFVSNLSYLRLALPEVSRPSIEASNEEPDELIANVFTNMGNDQLTLFSIGAPSGGLLPVAKLRKEIVLATRELREAGTEYESLPGNKKLRNAVATRSLGWGGNLTENDLVSTSGGMNALFLGLMAVGKPGDTVAVESPCFPGIFQLAISLGLKVLELPTHPTQGIEIDALKRVLPLIDICLLVPNFNTPLGSCMPDERKEEVVSLLSEHGIPLIEDDIYGDLYFGTQRPKCCKSFDTTGNVLWCGSVSKTLAPGYRVGWIAPGRYMDRVLKLKLAHSISSTSIVQEAVGNFFKTGKYERHVRQLRWTLQSNYQNYVNAVAEYFPEGTKTSRPQGGLALWVELPNDIDTTQLYNQALKSQISIAPGRMFTLQNQFQNCMRLCIGLPWNDSLKMKLKHIGNLAKAMTNGRH
ncbi:MAG: PLP-dependent aminotransferase family protein [Dyadobacter sp.]|uniref:aminotransferase-like domain-containing protein n=1 Tax=Dyadobacter sp. TaxID=1914288 RepID=UPI001B27D823|nr:PLP-dependent aminotransferase family protein [Dyadobacter sp.]MBO9611291.1 PLP-dependent aminotransferase family protein [Dyadobacter sp.]